MKKMMKKLIVLVIATTTILSISVVGVSASWKNDNHGWWNTEGNSYSIGWKEIESKWYYFDNNGYMKTGWLQDSTNWYYLNASGDMAVNTVVGGYTLADNGLYVTTTPVVSNNASSETATTSNPQNVSLSNPSHSSSDNNTKVTDIDNTSLSVVINPPKKSITDKENKITVFFEKNTGIIKFISSQVNDGTSVDDPNNEKYNYIVLDNSRENEVQNATKVVIENGKVNLEK